MSIRPVPARRGGRAALLLALVLGLAALVAVGVWLRVRSQAREEAGDATRGTDVETQRLRELAAAYYAKENRGSARETLALLVDRPRPAARDLIAAAVVELSEARTEAARAFLERARDLGDRSAELDYNLARIAYYDFEFPRAEQLLRAAADKAPGDVPTRLFLGQVLEELSAAGEERSAEVEALYRGVMEQGADAGLSWQLTATYRLAQLLQRQGREDEAAESFDRYDRLKERGVSTPTALQMEEGNLGTLAAPPPSGNRPVGPGELPGWEDAIVVLPQLAGASDLLAADLDEDCRLDLVAWGPTGLRVASQRNGFAWETRALVEEPVDAALAFDLGNDGDLDLLLAQAGRLHLLEAERDGEGDRLEWRPWTKPLPALPAAPQDLLAVDFDHEGDLDLLLVGTFGARLLRNDGADAEQPEGGFADVTAEAGLPLDRPFEWCLIEDLDTDQDVDLLLGGPEGAFLADNQRGGTFADASDRLAAVGTLRGEPLVADLDGDARPDLWKDDGLLLGRPLGAFEAGPAWEQRGTLPAGVRLRSADLDLDGSLDVFWLAEGAVHGRLSVGLPGAKAFELDPQAASEPRDVLLADLDGDLANDLAVLGADGLEIRRGAQQGNAVRLRYRGQKDNRQSIGAVIEVRAGPIYRRIFSRGEPELVGLGGQAEVDYVRVLWPNGVLQHDLRHTPGDRACDSAAAEAFQPEGLVGSCPFLYTWNGERYEFVSDVLGITPLGLPMAPGRLVPPDHDEYVLVTAEQLAPRDGVYELQFTEELREVTYLDRIRLDVIDHPAGTELYPDERFCFPPFADGTPHLVAAPLPPLRAVDPAGRDWARELARIDGEHAVPFDPTPGQMLGLATPHFLELEFDAAAVAAGSQLRLLMTGWFYWTDASVNVAAARDPRFEFVPPILQVPDGQGGWRALGPPVGFPAGKTKTMVLDVTGALDAGDPRLRVFTTLRLYWDSIRLSTTPVTVPLATRSLEPQSAELWRRGFSAPLRDGREHQPERFVWEQLAEHPRWNPHPGRYTRLGECLPLLQAIDDRFVIMATGDALTVRFDATALPPLPDGWRRDFLVFLDGWAKDRDPNTVEALYVEPLPFHGMSAYPYGPGERFPDTEEHRRWRREWNTRDAEPWIPFQAPEGSPFPTPPAR
jgi:tetratricopeptide (TPR) repeat protein